MAGRDRGEQQPIAVGAASRSVSKHHDLRDTCHGHDRQANWHLTCEKTLPSSSADAPTPRKTHTRRPRSCRLTALVAVAILVAGRMVARTSMAAFTATTSNPSDHWATATVVLADDDNGSARFAVTRLVPGGVGATDTKCVNVSYTGTASADIRMYATLSSDTGLSQYLTFTVEEGTGGTFANCAAFVAGGPALYSGTLSGFATDHPDWTNGVSSWQASGNGNETYRITCTLPDNNSAQGKAVDATFTWEVRST